MPFQRNVDFLYYMGRVFLFFFLIEYGARFLKYCTIIVNTSFCCKLIYISNLCEIVSI